MFTKNDQSYLIRAISNNQALLFLGSGFSRDTKNSLGESLPSGKLFGEKIWHFLKYPGPHDNTSLPEMYQAFLAAGNRNKQQKIDFLLANLMAENIPELYLNLTLPFWYKIYTTNIDNVIPVIFTRAAKNFKILAYPKDEYAERDQSLEKMQIVYLHGKLPCDPEEVIFSTQQYAKSQLAHQPLYSQFVYDYATLPTIFVGTDLNEPLFERYIVAREGKFGVRELRPKSFLISPSLSPVKADNLKSQYNVHFIPGTTEQFLTWLDSIKTDLPTKEDTLRRTFPNLLKTYEFASIPGMSNRIFDEFAQSFIRVPKDQKIIKERSGFLLGTSPTWNDIIRELDIPRSITNTVIESVEKTYNDKNTGQKIKVINIIGYAGSGKSTILKRTGFTLSQTGHTVFLTYSDYMPRIEDIISVLRLIEGRVVLLFDNARNVISQLPAFIKKFIDELKQLPIIILAIRTNHSDKLDYFLDPDIIDIESYKIPDLNDTEITNLIAKLDQNNLLGVLKGKNPTVRFNEFKYRANRQILIAMIEATNGKSFSDIIRDEFNSISPEEAKVLCTCIALNTELGYTNTKQDLIGFSKAGHNQALNYLETVLNGTILWLNAGNKFMLRHRVLADHIIKHCVPLGMLKEAYIRVLSILAPELKRSSGSSKKFILYKSLINHQILYRRFKSSIEQAREVFDSITEYFNDDANFWLQYGSLEVEGKGGDLKLAENYLKQAESLNPDSYYIMSAKCNLYYKLSCNQESYEQAISIKEEADTMAQRLILSTGKVETHIYNIYCIGRYRFILRWVHDRLKKRNDLRDLKKTIETAIKLHPRDRRLDTIYNAINRAFLNLGLDSDIEDPEIPDFI